MQMETLRQREMERALTLRLPADLYEELRAFAEEQDRPMARVLRSAVREFLAQHRVS
jgi:predicted transcriptional regulator